MFLDVYIGEVKSSHFDYDNIDCSGPVNGRAQELAQQILDYLDPEKEYLLTSLET